MLFSGLINFYLRNMKLGAHLFWDTDQEKINPEMHARKIIERVLTRGTLEDRHEFKNYYGLDRIISETLQIRYLDELTLNFVSSYFNIPKSQFKCSTTSPLIHEP